MQEKTYNVEFFSFSVCPQKGQTTMFTWQSHLDWKCKIFKSGNFIPNKPNMSLNGKKHVRRKLEIDNLDTFLIRTIKRILRKENFSILHVISIQWTHLTHPQ